MRIQVIALSLVMSFLWYSSALAQGPLEALSVSDSGRADRAGKLHLHFGELRTAELPNLLAHSQGRAASSHDRRFVLQLDGPITVDRRAKLERLGVSLDEYIPHFAYVARLADVRPSELAACPFVIFLGEYSSEWKLDADFGTTELEDPERRRMAAAGLVTARVSFFRGVAEADAYRAIAKVAGITQGRSLPTRDETNTDGPRVAQSDMACIHAVTTVAGNAVVAVTMRASDIPALTDEDSIQFIEEAPGFTFRSAGVRWQVQTEVPGATPFYDRGLHGEGELIGLLDGPVNPFHCSFYDNVPFGDTHRKIFAYNGPLGADSHATHTAGVAAGEAGSVLDTRGVAHGSKLVLGPVPSYTETSVYDSFAQHHYQGARVHMNSWGNDFITTYDSVCRGIDAFCWDYETSTVLWAASNTNSISNPENAKNLLAVAAAQGYPNENEHCYGGWGPTADGRRKPEICAPGCWTAAADASTTCDVMILPGTSSATAALAGMAAIVRQYYTSGYYPTGTPIVDNVIDPSGALMKATLLNAAVDMLGVTDYPNDLEGWGRIAADGGCYFPGDSRNMVVLDDVFRHEGMETGDYRDYYIQVYDASQVVKITLAWTDAPASAATGHGIAAVNDLDLAVYAPDGTQYIGNVFQNGVSVPGGWWDYDNNVEQVHLSFPAQGVYRIRVTAPAVNWGEQGFALIATGGIGLGGSWIDVCGTGAMSSGCGPREELMVVNGTTGGLDRTLFVRIDDPLEFDLAEPKAEVFDGIDSPACIYLWMTEPIAIDVVQLPKRLGLMCFGPSYIASYPAHLIFNALGRPNKLGAHNAPTPKPYLPDDGQFLPFYTLPNGLGTTGTMTVQGIVPDGCSQGNVPFSVTNAVMIRVQ